MAGGSERGREKLVGLLCLLKENVSTMRPFIQSKCDDIKSSEVANQTLFPNKALNLWQITIFDQQQSLTNRLLCKSNQINSMSPLQHWQTSMYDRIGYFFPSTFFIESVLTISDF